MSRWFPSSFQDVALLEGHSPPPGRNLGYSATCVHFPFNLLIFNNLHATCGFFAVSVAGPRNPFWQSHLCVALYELVKRLGVRWQGAAPTPLLYAVVRPQSKWCLPLCGIAIAQLRNWGPCLCTSFWVNSTCASAPIAFNYERDMPLMFTNTERACGYVAAPPSQRLDVEN